MEVRSHCRSRQTFLLSLSQLQPLLKGHVDSESDQGCVIRFVRLDSEDGGGVDPSSRYASWIQAF